MGHSDGLSRSAREMTRYARHPKSAVRGPRASKHGAMEVTFTTDAAEALAGAREFLATKPIEHNLLLTLLEFRAAWPQDGRYWTATDAGRVVGFLFQSPATFHATLSPMPPAAVDAMVEAAADVELPGVIGEASTAARFAGKWTEVRKSAARPTSGQRIYELTRVQHPNDVAGTCRVAVESDIAELIDWMRGFVDETNERATDPTTMVPPRVAAGQFFLWDDNGGASTAATSPVIEGVTRIQAVYTPPNRRGRGYAAANVAAISSRAVDAGNRCMLYTELENPVSNSVYRRIGYQAVSEVLRYQFEAG